MAKTQIFEEKLKFLSKKFGSLKILRTFAIPNEKKGSNAEIAQLVEHNLAKVRVASSSLVFRSKKVSRNADLNFAKPDVVQLYMQSFSYRDGFFLFVAPYPLKHRQLQKTSCRQKGAGGFFITHCLTGD